MLATTEHPTSAGHAASHPLRICLLGYRSNPYSGGQGIYLKCLSKALVDAGHSVDVISGQPYPELDHRVKLIKLPGLNLFASSNHVTALRPKHLLSFTDFFEWFSMLTGGFPEPYTFGRRLVRYFNRHQPQYDIVHDNQSLCYGALRLQHMGVPLVTTIHHPITSDLQIALQSSRTWRNRLLTRRWHSFIRMQKKVAKKLHHLVTVSNTARADIAEAFVLDEAHIHVIHNGIDTDIFKPNPGIEREACTLMATASADAPLKGLHYLLRAVAELAAEYNIQLNVLGQLKPNGSTARLIKRLNITARITFYSGLTAGEVADLYAGATIAVVPSIYEGFGLPAGEAMACGVPVVSTDGGALPEVVGDCGIIVPARSHTAIATAVRSLLEDEPGRLALGASGRARILQLFRWEATAKDMANLYGEIIRATPVTRPADNLVISSPAGTFSTSSRTEDIGV